MDNRLTSEMTVPPAQTPGPWTVRRTHPNCKDIVYVCAGWDEICVLYCSPETSTNGNLIAAAPNLLALAKQYASECSNCDGTGLVSRHIEGCDVQAAMDADDQPCQDCADIRAVIDKAEGRV